MFNCSRIVLNCLRPIENNLLNNTKILTAQQKRTTYIVKRKNPVALYKKAGPPYAEKLKKRHFIYEVEQYTLQKKQEPLDVILLEYVEGVGNKGQRVSLKPLVAYRDFLLPGIATYASPENVAKYELKKENIMDKKYSSLWVERTINILSTLVVVCFMNHEIPWVLEKWHIRASLRRAGIICPDEAITMPEKTISGPNMDINGKEFYVTVTINRTETVKVRCRIQHFYNNPTLSASRPESHFLQPAEAIFPEDQEVLDSMPLHRLIEANKNSNSEAES